MSDLYIRRNLREQLQANNTAHRLEDSGEIFARVLVQRVLTSSGWQERIVAQAGADGELVDGDGNAFAVSTGVTNASEANPGEIGEFKESVFSSILINNMANTPVASIALTPGDWDVTGFVNFSSTQGESGWSIYFGINTAIDIPDAPYYWTFSASPDISYNGGSAMVSDRVNISSPTTIYLVGYLDHSNSESATAWGYLRARRDR